MRRPSSLASVPGACAHRSRTSPTWRSTGPYAFWKTAGPARYAITDRGLTFATNGDRGVLISFEKPVRGLDPLGILRHPELTVTVADVDGLADLLRGRSNRR